MKSTSASPQPAHRARWAAAGLVALAGFLLFHFFGNASRGYIATDSLFYWWGFQWTNAASETQHGWMILALSCWIFWRNLAEARTAQTSAGNGGFLDRSPSSLAPAVCALGAGLALHALGFVAQQARVSVVGLLMFLWGAVRLGGGQRWGGAAVFPLAFLVFALPLGVLDSLGFGLWLRMRVVDASRWLAFAANIPVLRSGTQLVAPDGTYNYDVAAACSGVRSLAAITALSLLAGYLNFSSGWRRGLVLLVSFPLVYLGNVARIMTIILAAHAGGPTWGDRAHEVMGYGVFVIVFGGVLGAIALIRRWSPEREGGQGARPSSATFPDTTSGGRAPLGTPRSAWIVTAVIVVITSVEMMLLRGLADSAASGRVGVELAADGSNPAELPGFIGTEWIGRRMEVTAVERDLLPADTGYSRRSYVAVSDPRQQVFLSIVLSGRDRTSIHRPELCLVGQGWTITSQQAHQFASSGSSQVSFPATLLRVQRELASTRGKTIVPQLTAYWFVGADKVVGSHWGMFFQDAWQRVTRGRADRWAYVLMQTDAQDGETAALARMQTVLEATLPTFQRQPLH